MDIIKSLICIIKYYILPSDSGEFWSAFAGIATMIAAITAIVEAVPRTKLKLSIDFCCGKIYKGQSVKLIKITILNCGKIPAYITGFGIRTAYKKYYQEVIDPNDAAFYYKTLPITILPGKSEDVWMSFDYFYNAILSEKNHKSKNKYNGYVTDSFGKIWLSKEQKSYFELTKLFKISNEELTKYSILKNEKGGNQSCKLQKQK